MKTIAQKGIRFNELTDESLITAVLSGQERACTILVRRHEALLHYVLRSYLHDYGARQEIIQDTFLRAFRALPGFRAESKFSTWLAKIAISAAISRLHLRRYATWDTIDTILSQWEVDRFVQERSMEKQERNRMLRMTVEKLDSNDAKALDLFYFQERSIVEIEQLTGWTTNTIKSRLFRARQRLHAALLKQGLQAECFA